MATTYEEIIGFLDEEGVKYRDRRHEGRGLMLVPRNAPCDEASEVLELEFSNCGGDLWLWGRYRPRGRDNGSSPIAFCWTIDDEKFTKRSFFEFLFRSGQTMLEDADPNWDGQLRALLEHFEQCLDSDESVIIPDAV